MSLRSLSWSSSLRCLVILLGTVLLSTLPLRAQGYSTVYNFTGSPDGANPQSGLIMDTTGNLYGTTKQGGSSTASGYGTGYGTVFKVNPGGQNTVLYAFTGGADGAWPVANLMMDAAGNLYGTTWFGGDIVDCPTTSYIPGCGVVFKIDTSGNETVLYTFCSQSNCTDGAFPRGGLIMDAAGNLYGTTGGGGNTSPACGAGCGVVFELVKANNYAETVLHVFTGIRTGNDGNNPFGNLVMDASGNLYGTTVVGGTYTSCLSGNLGCGTIFKIDTRGNESVLYAFAGGSDGSEPLAGLIMDAAGNLYGTTGFGGGASCGGAGCGTVFKVDTSGHETVLYSFRGQNNHDGAEPEGGLVMDSAGNLYGTTYFGGALSFHGGIIFQIDTSNNEAILYNFVAAGGDGVYGSLTMDTAGNLYGAAYGGGSSGLGTVFEVHLDNATDYAQLNGGNSFNGSQAVNGNLTATDLTGNGNGLTDLNAANIAGGTANISISGNAATATNATNALNATNAVNAINANNASNLGGIPALNYARLDIANLFGAKQTLTPSAAGYAALNVPNTGVVPSSPLMGDLWLTVADPHMQFVDLNSVTQSIAYLSDINSADNTLLNTAESYTLTQVSGERTRAEAAESSLSLGIAAETTRAENAESELSSAISDETSRAEEAEASKADLDGGNTFIGGKQVLAASTATYAALNLPNTGAVPSTPLMGDLWSTTADPHLQFRDMNSVIQSLAFVSDISSQTNQILNTAESYTNTQVGAETTRAKTAEVSLGTSIGNETARAEAAEATKANLSGGNSFSGNQTISGNTTVTGNESLSGNLAVAGTLSIGGGTPITQHLSALFNPSFGILKANTCATASFTFTGVATGDTMALGLPNTRMTGPGVFVYMVWANAANNITIQACNVSGTNQKTAGSGNIRVDDWKH